MRKTGELSTPEGLNHTDPFNVVSEGVKQDITEAAPTANDIEMVEQARIIHTRRSQSYRPFQRRQ